VQARARDLAEQRAVGERRLVLDHPGADQVSVAALAALAATIAAAPHAAHTRQVNQNRRIDQQTLTALHKSRTKCPRPRAKQQQPHTADALPDRSSQETADPLLFGGRSCCATQPRPIPEHRSGLLGVR
jgi:hypothetical protein